MPPTEARTVPREPLFAIADLRFADTGQSIRATVRNLSAGGMMIERDMLVRRGERVTVLMRNSDALSGTIVWVRRPLFGMAFETAIDPQPLRAALFSPLLPASR